MNLLPFFVAGLAASVHCVGMCGGIAATLGGTAAPPPSGGTAAPLVFHAPRGGAAAVNATNALPEARVLLARLLRIAGFNAGRIATYMMAGAVAGGMAQGVLGLAAAAPLQKAALALANLMLLAAGLYLMNAWRGLAHVERAGQHVWRHVQPLLRPLLPMDTPAKALAAGALWGWLPCGLVYSMLVTAMLSGDGVNGAAIMLAFGLGTMPLLFAVGMAGMALRRFLQRRAVRIACGGLVMAFGVLGLMRLAGVLIPGMPSLHGWADVLCIGGV
jgi:sulfite exporter TauE/SafE